MSHKYVLSIFITFLKELLFNDLTFEILTSKYDSDANMLSIKIAKADYAPVLEDIVAQLQHVKQANVALSGGLDSSPNSLLNI